MRYYVLAVDGKTYGPVDLDGLRQWIREGRIVASTRLREESTGRELSAADVPELRSQFGVNGATGAASGNRYEPNRCPHCGGAMAFGQAQCAQCGTLLGFGHQPRTLITGSLTADRVFGFVVGFFSWFLWGIGAFGALILYFVLRSSYPVFARSLGFGLLSIVVIFLGACAICLVALAGMGTRW